MTDEEIDDGYDAIFRIFNRGVVRLLLSGNDVGCFTTEQFARKADERWPSKLLPPLGLERARQHLLDLPELREVKPDVWAAVEQPTP